MSVPAEEMGGSVMAAFIAKRVGLMFITLFFIVTITFFLMRSIPGDPLASMGRALPAQARDNFLEKYSLNDPLPVQYLRYLQNLVKLDLGDSLHYPGRSVGSMIATMSPVSAKVGGIALLAGTLIGVALGITAALFKNKWPDYLVMFLAIIGTTVPPFVLASLMQFSLSVQMGLLPSSGWGQPRHYVMPVIALSFGTIATYARYMKSGMLDTLSQDYILTAQSKGVSEFNVVWKHAMRNSILPSITMLAARIVGIFTGSFVIERMFSIPGLGKYFVDSINNNDYSMTLGLTVFFSIFFVVAQLLVDIVYVLVDPRIKLAPNAD